MSIKTKTYLTKTREKSDCITTIEVFSIDDSKNIYHVARLERCIENKTFIPEKSKVIEKLSHIVDKKNFSFKDANIHTIEQPFDTVIEALINPFYPFNSEQEMKEILDIANDDDVIEIPNGIETDDEFLKWIRSN